MGCGVQDMCDAARDMGVVKMGADMVQLVVFLMLAAAVVLAAAACIGETMRLRDAHKDMELRVFALENELLHLHAPKAADDSTTFENLQQPHHNPVITTRGARCATRTRGAGDGRIHYEIGRDGAREKRA